MGPRGVLGQFEWNSRAGRGVIRFFENANETTLFHENAHALVILMGRAWRDRLVRQFDSAEGVDRYGRRTGRLELTRKGHEQAAESLAMYWLTKTASPAGINKMFDQLYLRLRELWATIRNEPLTEKMTRRCVCAGIKHFGYKRLFGQEQRFLLTPQPKRGGP